jgi:cytochrome P450
MAPHVDPTDPAWYDDPWPAIRWLHAEAPVHRCPGGLTYPKPFWILSRYDDVRHVSGEPELFTSTLGIHLADAVMQSEGEDSGTGGTPDDPLLAEALTPSSVMPVPTHNRVRGVARPGLQARQVARLEPMIRDITRRCLDAIEPGDAVDFTKTVAERIPMDLMCGLLGVDVSRSADFRRWSDAIIGSFEPGAAADWPSIHEMLAFVAGEMADRRRAPRDDLITELVQGRYKGEGLSDGEIMMWVWNLLVGGQETTVNMLSGGVLALLEHPVERDRLVADRSLAAGATAEILRWTAPVRYMRRTATADTEIRGTAIAAGDVVMMSYTAANRDPAVFEDPYRFDISRNWDRDHLAFGFGQHFCIGAALARLEGQVVLEELFDRFPRLEAAGPPVLGRSTIVNPVLSLPLRMKP